MLIAALAAASCAPTQVIPDRPGHPARPDTEAGYAPPPSTTLADDEAPAGEPETERDHGGHDMTQPPEHDDSDKPEKPETPNGGHDHH